MLPATATAPAGSRPFPQPHCIPDLCQPHNQGYRLFLPPGITPGRQRTATASTLKPLHWLEKFAPWARQQLSQDFQRFLPPYFQFPLHFI